MTVDLKELDALHAAASAGPWEAVTDDDANDEVRLVEAAPRRHARGGGRIVPALMMTPKADAECIVALHNAYPAMAAEIRALRSEARGLADDLRSLREDIMAVAAGGAVRWTKHAMGKAGLVPERRTIDNTPCTCGEANTQEKGRHDEDCPSVGL